MCVIANDESPRIIIPRPTNRMYTEQKKYNSHILCNLEIILGALKMISINSYYIRIMSVCLAKVFSFI